ncbi:MAG: hypothetical protein A3B82_04025 [Methylophilales bacterium RIFCSPHIGHO2_02_FULL_57_10]|nr:MAG: hypothetical protein A3B82_04025 [Methylophilales bacterium RIFCSPHIGHO2_02_FULL_57_10]
MSRIVLTWELGGNFGHVGRLSGLASILAAQGHEVFLLLKELHNLANVPRQRGIRILQAPVWLPEVKGLPDPPMNYSEMLLRFGYHDPRFLGGLAEAWRTQFELCGADVVVADHSPTALLAARMMDIPSAAIGSGFFVPPLQSPMPSIRPWLNVPAQRLEQADQMVLATMNRLLEDEGSAPLGSVADLFDLPASFLMTFRELDHYSQRGEAARYYGVDFMTEIGDAVPWPDGDGTKVYAYLDPAARDFEAVVRALNAKGCRALVTARGISENARRMLETERVHIFDRPIRLAEILEECDLGITHASLATVVAFLMHGLPMLLLPTQLEQFLVGLRAEALGAAKIVNPDAPPPDYGQLVNELVSDPKYRHHAQSFADKYGDWDRKSILVGIANEIEQLV